MISSDAHLFPAPTMELREMSAADLLGHLRAHDVHLWVENDTLRYSAPKGFMTPDVLNTMVRQKREFMELINGAPMGLPESPRIPRAARPEGTQPPLSFAQQRLWFLDQLTPGNAFYNVYAAVPIEGSINSLVLRRSLEEIVRRHESLRTVFPTMAGEPVQSILAADAVSVDVPVVDLSGLSGPARDSEAARLASEAAVLPFDLARGPLLRACLLKHGETSWTFLLTMHHIVSDGWSMKIFSRELSAIYAAFAAGLPSPLPDLPIQYADFAVWQRARLSGPERERQMSYWRNQLQGLEPLAFPTDRSRPTAQSFRGAAVPVTIAADVTRALRLLGSRNGATPFMVLLAVFAVLLRRYTSQNDITIGTYVANRAVPELESLIGFFVNTLAMRVDTSGDPSFEELLKRVQRTAMGAYEHEDLPFPELVQELHPDRDMSRNPIFQVLLTLSSSEHTRGNTPKSSVPAAGSGQSDRPAIFDVVLDLEESPDGISGSLAYSTDLFDAATAERIAQYFVTLTNAAVTTPHHRISDLPLLSVGERRRLLIEWNSTCRSYPEIPGIAGMFDERVKLMPDAPALFCNGESLTFSELARRGDRIRAILMSADAGASSLVGIYIERSFDTVAAILAVHQSGAAYVPLDPAYPKDRIAFMLRDSGVRVVLTSSNILDTLPEGVIGIPIDQSEPLALGTESAAIPAPRSSGARDIAYVIYTSGSTGVPKGVVVEHRQILNRLYWMWEAYPFEADEVCCQKTALNFVDSIWEIYGPLLRGVPSVIIPDEAVRDMDALTETLARYRVTRLWFVPPLLRALLDANEIRPKPLPSLKFWVSSGEPLTSDLVVGFKKAFPGADLYNLYGTSEIWDATWFDTATDSNRANQNPLSVPIGRPISNVRVYVLDENLQPLPIGVYGELYVAGDGLALEYLNSPQLTAERFIRDPFAPDLERAFGKRIEPRMYRTGDMVRWRADGNIEFRGRADRQLKVRGFRVEPGEIETALRAHHRVQEAVVTAWPEELSSAETGAGSDTKLVAYIVSVGAALPAEDLDVWLRSKLPEFMLPSIYIPLEALPKTPSGKVDRRALPPPKASTAGRNARESLRPQTETERAVAGIWAEVLRITPPDSISINDDFFRDAGGHSLLATQFVTRVRDRLKVSFPLRAIFEQPTIRGIAGIIDAARAISDPNPAALDEMVGRAAGTTAIPRLARDRYRITFATNGDIEAAPE